MSEFERQILSALKQCQRDGVQPIARNVTARLPEAFSYQERWVRHHLRRLAEQGNITRIGKRKGFLTDTSGSHRCPTCGQVVYKQLALF